MKRRLFAAFALGALVSPVASIVTCWVLDRDPFNAADPFKEQR